MKKMMLTFALVVVGLATLASPTSVQVKHSRKNLFAFTVDRMMRGAHVQVFHESGDLVVAQKLRRRKMIIDFCDVCPGNYTIVIVADDGRTERFQYEKR